MNRDIKSEVNVYIVFSGFEQESVSIVTELTVEGRILSTLGGMDFVKDRLSGTFVPWLKNFHAIGVPLRRIWLKSESDGNVTN